MGHTLALLTISRGAAAQFVKLLYVKFNGYFRIPGIIAALTDNQVVSSPGSQLIQRTPNPVENGFQRIKRIGTAFLGAPQELNQFLLRNHPRSVINHVRQQEPYFAGPISSIINPIFSHGDGEFAQHPYLQWGGIHSDAPPPIQSSSSQNSLNTKPFHG